MIVSNSSNNLARCTAVIFAPSEGNATALVDLATQLGFGAVFNYSQNTDLPTDRMTYYLVHALLPDASKMRVIHGLRASEHIFRRFAPIVCVVNKGPRHQVVPLMQMGFDEVLFTVDGNAEMGHKLGEQVLHPLLYVQSEHYFGPDRRRIERVDPNDPRRKPGGSPYRKIRVLRDPQSGISTMEIA